jgi:hypothetical protein
MLGVLHVRKWVASLMRHRPPGRATRRIWWRGRLPPTAPNRLWLGDITYARTWSGWLCLAVVLETFGRRVVGRQITDNLESAPVVERSQHNCVESSSPAGAHSRFRRRASDASEGPAEGVGLEFRRCGKRENRGTLH